MTKYYRIRRQLIALLVGALVALPTAVVAVFLSPSSGPSMDIGHAAHSQLGGILLLLLLALNMGSFVATLLNYFFPIATCFVIASLAFDAYKISHYRSGKLLALCVGVCLLVAAWYYLQSDTANFVGLLPSYFAPFLSAALGLLAIFITLAISRRFGRTA